MSQSYKKIRAAIREIKSQSGCVTKGCKERDPRKLQFHHRDRKKKKFNICDAVRGKVHGVFTLEAIMIEIRKCDVMCDRHHTELHKKERADEKRKDKPRSGIILDRDNSDADRCNNSVI